MKISRSSVSYTTLLRQMRKLGYREKNLVLTRTHGCRLHGLCATSSIQCSVKGDIIKPTGSWWRKTYKRTYHGRYIFELRNKDEFSWPGKLGLSVQEQAPYPWLSTDIRFSHSSGGDSHGERSRDSRRLIKWCKYANFGATTELATMHL